MTRIRTQKYDGQDYDLEELVFGSVVPVHCKVCGYYISQGEPDAEEYHCDRCNNDTGYSVLILEEVM